MAGRLEGRWLWIFPHAGRSMGTAVAEWVAPVLMEAGAAVDMLPLLPAPADRAELGQVAGVRFTAPPVTPGFMQNVLATGALRRLLTAYDHVLVDQDLDLEVRTAIAGGALRQRARMHLLVRHPLQEYLAAQGEHRVGRLRRYLERYLPSYEQVICFGDKIREDVLVDYRVPKARVVRLPLPVPFEGLNQGEAVGAAEGWPFAEEESGHIPVIAMMGYLDVLKGGAILIHAARLMADAGSPVRLLILGDGPERAALEHLTKTLRVEAAFVGWAEEPGRWLRRADVFVAPQYFDGTGLDLLSAMSVGVPVIACNAPSVVTEVLAKGTVGKIISVGEPPGMAEAITKWLENDRVRQAFAVGGRQRARAWDRAKVSAGWVEALGPTSAGD